VTQPMRAYPRELTPPQRRRCDYCGAPFYQGRDDHRFCTVECNRRWHVEERRAAIAFWRARARGQQERRA
jgi:hypothetical protein